MYLIVILFIVGCVPKHQQTEVFLKDSIYDVVDSFIVSYPYKETYELHINKETPHNGTLIIYGGTGSVVFQENEHINQCPIVYTIIREKKINIYSGIERYTKSIPTVYSNYLDDDATFWLITDSFNVISVNKSYERLYPFIAPPLEIKENIFSLAVLEE